ncbi:MAG: family 2 glycosyl transferase [Anaerolineae bacterium UTCFX2]|jgi:glycosyltransferase involved in cell wall biosynthesis|nr:glycosyltransferase family 2 protein [Anaerolineae bacterium]MCZ7552306.1 glycosyltransferase family 2 protein [Anaerolineales bacterium]OQY93291.1 MAG: family 2 glycosyl transferase [Anaerolineae bacterium UTCFX2]
MNCSIVIRAFNEERHLGRLLDGIAQQTLQATEVILVDSGSTDRTPAIAAAHGARVLHLRPEDFSFGRSLNLGIAAAQHDKVVIASAHVYPVYPDWLERLLAPLSDPHTALSYGKQRGNSDSRFSEQQIFQSWFPDRSDPRQPHPFCNNANAAIQRELWQKQPYDETLTGLEDLAWARQAMDRGFSIVYAADAEVIHVHHETPHGVYNRYRREAMAYKQIFPAERFSFNDLLQLISRNIWNDVRQASRQKSLQRHLPSILWFRFMQFWGAYQGHRHPSRITEQLRRTFYYPDAALPPESSGRREIDPIHYSEP